MRLAYTFVFSLALINRAYTTTSTVDQADPAHTKHPEEPAKPSWFQRLRIGTTMKDGNFISDQNPLHPDKRDAHDPLHSDHHTHEEEVILRFFGHHLPHSDKDHNLESCPGLHASTEENLRAMRRLLNSAYSLIEGLEWSNDPSQIEHAHQHHHLILDNEPFRTSCADMQSSTVTELKMIETLLRGARKMAGDLAHNWEGVHHFAPEIFDHDGHHEHEGHHTDHYGHEEHYLDHYGHDEHYAGHHGHEEHYTGHHGHEEEYYHGHHDSHGHFDHDHVEYGHTHPEGHYGHEHGHFEHHDGHSHLEHAHPGDHHETQHTFRKDH